MQRSHRIGIGFLALALFVGGCYGPFNLTRRLYRWNGQVGTTKWEREFVFVLLAWLPVYGLTVLGDAVVFNSMEFWTGNNPVEPPTMRKGSLPMTKRIARGESEAVLTYTPAVEAASLQIQQFQQQHPAGALRIEQRNGVTMGLDADGQVLFTAQTRPDGRVLINDAGGKQVAAYSSDQVDQFFKSARQ